MEERGTVVEEMPPIHYSSDCGSPDFCGCTMTGCPVRVCRHTILADTVTVTDPATVTAHADHVAPPVRVWHAW